MPQSSCSCTTGSDRFRHSDGGSIALIYAAGSRPSPNHRYSAPRGPADAPARPRRLVRLREVGLGESVDVCAPHQYLRGGIARAALEDVVRHVRKVGVEVRIVAGDAHPVGAHQAGGCLDLRLAALDRGPAIAPEVLLRG